MGRKPRSDRQPGRRQPNGRLSQIGEFERARKNANAELEQWDAMSAAMMARHRLHDLPYPPAAKDGMRKDRPHVLDQRAGSVIGRMAMRGELSASQYEAAVKYIEDVDNYRRAISAPRQPGAVDLNAVRGSGATGPDHVAFVERAKRRYMGDHVKGERGVVGTIRECQNSIANRGSNLFAALDYLVLRDEFYTHMVADCRIALNALARHYGFLVKAEECAA